MLLGHDNALALVRVLTIVQAAGHFLFLLPLCSAVEAFAFILVAPDLNSTSTYLADIILYSGSHEFLYPRAVVLARSPNKTQLTHPHCNMILQGTASYESMQSNVYFKHSDSFYVTVARIVQLIPLLQYFVAWVVTESSIGSKVSWFK